jgi:hypothetical protein
MKKTLFVYLLLFLFIITHLHSQGASGKKVSKKEQEEKSVLKPPAYDSTQTLEEQYKLENQYQFIGLQLFLPPIVNPDAGPIVFSKKGFGFEKGNKYYTIIDILQGNAIEQLKQKNLINQCGSRYKDFNSPQWKEMIVYVIFVLKDNNKNDSLNNAPLYWVVSQSKIPPYTCSYFNSFIIVPYFEKQKQIYLHQDVINLSDKSKWVCNEVVFIKSKDVASQDSTYDVYCLLKNDKGEQVQQRPPSEKYGRTFITEKEYIRLDHANRNQKEELIKAENDKKEKHKSECISRFGQHKGELIAQSKIEIGMTTEMCKVAWGAPWDISPEGMDAHKTTTSSGTKEVWFYNWKYKLYFKNGILVKVEH